MTSMATCLSLSITILFQMSTSLEKISGQYRDCTCHFTSCNVVGCHAYNRKRTNTTGNWVSRVNTLNEEWDHTNSWCSLTAPFLSLSNGEIKITVKIQKHIKFQSMQTLLKDRRAYPSCIPINSITGNFYLHTAHGQTIESQESLSKIITSATQTKQLSWNKTWKKIWKGD